MRTIFSQHLTKCYKTLSLANLKRIFLCIFLKDNPGCIKLLKWLHTKLVMSQNGCVHATNYLDATLFWLFHPSWDNFQKVILMCVFTNFQTVRRYLCSQRRNWVLRDGLTDTNMDGQIIDFAMNEILYIWYGFILRFFLLPLIGFFVLCFCCSVFRIFRMAFPFYFFNHCNFSHILYNVVRTNELCFRANEREYNQFYIIYYFVGHFYEFKQNSLMDLPYIAFRNCFKKYGNCIFQITPPCLLSDILTSYLIDHFTFS